MSGLPRATVVVPVRNGGEGIERLARSLVALDYPADRIEVIVVDNRSTDGAAARVAASGVRVIRADALASSYHARNVGWLAGSGEWIAFTDADCVAPEGWLRALLAPPIPDGAGAILGEVEALEAETTVQRLTERFGIMKHAVTMPHKRLPCFSTANVAIRRDVLERLGGFREDVRYFGDMELSWRMQLDLGVALAFRPEAAILHRHRRTWAALWRQGVQHGRGVAFMKRTFPERYAIDSREQVGRLGGILRALAREGAPGAMFQIVWFTGMTAGYLRGPAWSRE